ncbi:MAG: hypothetical protein HFH72_09140 [Lachnospiraceae bacterium]|nr:hypothetical protein [Lachnospiraceae bacterium]
MATKNEVAQRNISALSWWSNELTNMVSQDYEDCGLVLDEYSKQCAMAAMTNIFQLVKNSGIDIKAMDTSNLREIVGQAASLKLNANAVPRECYFQLRSFKSGNEWKKKVEMGIEGDGNDAILRNFGENVEMVYPVWIVKEGDEFTYPKHKGIEITPPEWEQTGESEKADKVVYPVKLKDSSMQYLIAERQSVKTNLFAHVRNNLMNETFGLVKGGKKTRYDATDKELEAIAQKKEEIFEALRKCETVEDMLNCPEARPFISAAWLDTPENMIVRKMRNNAIKKFKKNYDTMAQRSFLQMDETYQQVQEEIEENANTVDFQPIEEQPAPQEPEPAQSEQAAEEQKAPF